MKTIFFKISILFFVLSFSNVHSENLLPMSVLSRDITNYQNFLIEQNKSVLEIDSLESQYSNRNIACIVIIMQALHKGGYPAKLSIIKAPNYARELSMVKNGHSVIMHQDTWNTAFDNNSVYKSSEIIPRGKFVKGFYVKESDKKMYGVRNLEDLKPFTSVSNSRWEVDWATLEKIGLRNLYTTAKKEYMIKMVLFRDIDFTLQEFTSSKDLSYETENGKLIPVPGIKIALEGSRHFMVSKKHPNGNEVFQALEKGIKILRSEGTIDRYLTEAGFYREQVAEWKTIN
jgi:hypothetical protein